ncbi:MAG: hypothetical protein ACYDGX_01140 [Thermoleophilia bacterium]
MTNEKPPASFKNKLTLGSVLLIAGSILSIAGSFMSWANLGFLSVSGSSGDGKFTAAAGAVLLIVVIFVYSAKKRNAAITFTIGFLVGLLTLFVTTYDGTNIGNSGNAIISASVGMGIYIVFLGGVLSVLGSISLLANLGKDNFYKLGELSKKNQAILVAMVLFAVAIVLVGYLSANGKAQGSTIGGSSGESSQANTVTSLAQTATATVSEGKDEASLRSVAQQTFDSASAGDYGKYWDFWTNDAQTLLNRQDTIKFFTECRKLTGYTVNIQQIAIQDNSAEIQIQMAGVNETTTFNYEDGGWRYDPSDSLKAKLKGAAASGVEAEVAKEKSAGNCLS